MKLFAVALLLFAASNLARATEPPLAPASITTLSLPLPRPTDNVLAVNNGAREVVRITRAGKIYFNGHEVKTDRQYRAAMMAILKGAMGCQP
jgi:ribosomal protein S4E